MSSGRYDLTLETGSCKPLHFTRKVKATGLPIDNTGGAAQFVILSEATGAQLLSLTSASGRITLGGVDGWYDMAINESEIAAIAAVTSRASLRFYVTPAGGCPQLKLHGLVQVKTR